MIPVLRALTAVHAEGFIHRDVTPDNIYITKDGMVKLLDFGSARYSIGDKSKSLDVILKVGYAPKEQYIRRSRQGPFTDVYSCAACFYAAITGFLPPESLERLDSDTLVPISQCGIEIPEYLDKAILKGLAVQPEDRFQSAAEFLEAIERQQVVEVPAPGGAAAPAPTPEKKKVKPALIAGIAAAIVVAVGIGIAIGGGGGQTAVDADGEKIQLIKAEVPSITIQGQEYSTDLTELNLASLYLTDADVEQLKYMVNLRELDLPASSEITDLAPLSNLTQLKVLRMNDGNYTNAVTDLTPLASLTNLVNLQLSCMAEDLSPLAGLTNLKALSLYLPITVDDISFLTNLTNLQSLHIQDNSSGNAHIRLDDLTPLSGLTQLQELGLSVNGISDFDWAQNLTELRELSCWGNEATYTDLDGLKNLTKLQSLALPYPNIVGNEELDPEPYDIQGLAGLTELTYLQMYAGVKDLSPLANLTKLQTLYIYNGTTQAGGHVPGTCAEPDRAAGVLLLCLRGKRLRGPVPPGRTDKAQCPLHHRAELLRQSLSVCHKPLRAGKSPGAADPGVGLYQRQRHLSPAESEKSSVRVHLQRRPHDRHRLVAGGTRAQRDDKLKKSPAHTAKSSARTRSFRVRALPAFRGGALVFGGVRQAHARAGRLTPA